MKNLIYKVILLPHIKLYLFSFFFLIVGSLLGFVIATQNPFVKGLGDNGTTAPPGTTVEPAGQQTISDSTPAPQPTDSGQVAGVSATAAPTTNPIPQPSQATSNTTQTTTNQPTNNQSPCK